MVRASRLRLIASGEALRRRTQIVHTLAAAIGTAAPTAWLASVVDAMTAGWEEARREPRGFPALESSACDVG